MLLLAGVLAALVGCAGPGAVAPVEPYSRPGSLPAAAKTVAVAVADLDNDGKLDLAAGAVEPGAILILFGDGAGGVSAPHLIPVEGDVRSLAIADVNADGLADIVFSVQRQSSGIRVWLNRGQRRWEAGKSPIDINRYEGLRTGDINGDGHVDIVAANASSDAQGGIQVWLGNGRGDWALGPSPTVTGTFMDVSLADFNGDGRLDIAGSSWGLQGSVRVWLNAPGGWTALAPFARGSFYGLHAADINGDGRLDLAAGTYKDGVRLFWGDGRGGFREDAAGRSGLDPDPPKTHAAPMISQPAPEASFWHALPVDVDGDGRLDIVAGSLDNRGIRAWLNRGDAGWALLTDVYPSIGNYYGLVAADLNADGRPDIGAAHFGEGVTLWAGRAAGEDAASAAGAARASAQATRATPPALLENDVFRIVDGAVEYKIGPGDGLEITLWEGNTPVRQELLVRPDGKISFGLVENLAVEGRTARELDDLLTVRLEQYLKKPRVDVHVTQHKSKSVRLLGAVSRTNVFGSGAGEYKLQGKTTVLEMLTLAGGPTDDADLKSVRIRRKSGETVSLNLYQAIIQGDLTQDLVLNDGDLIYLPTLSKEANRVYVFGEVQKPGAYTFRGSEMRLIDAISEAGGITSFAYQADTRVVRGDITQPEILSANLLRLVENGDRSQNIQLASGDLVYVPRSGLGDIKLFYDRVRPLLEMVLWPARTVIDWNSAADIVGAK
ncbi:MAG: FG-GAP-like repeat-containing protein [Desulfobacterales bacterium]